jgi:ADP-heptose:LPS heptosyltransferase
MKILVIFPGALGDFVCFLPALERLAAGRGVDLLAKSEYRDLVPPAVATRSLECYEITRLFVPGAGKDERLKRFFGSYESIYSWMGSGHPDFIRRLQRLSAGRLKIFPFLPAESPTHATDHYLSCLGENHMRHVFPTVRLKSDALHWGRRFWLQHGLEKGKVLALAPGSGAREKNWPAEFYKVVIEWWEKRFGGKIIVVLGPVEEQKGETGNDWGHTLVAQGLDLAKVAALLSRCDLYLGNDSGVTHIAAALGVESVALFGPTAPGQWAPRGKKVTVVTKNVECSPCDRAVMKVCPHRKCLTMLGPGEVIPILERLSQRGKSVQGIETPIPHPQILI